MSGDIAPEDLLEREGNALELAHSYETHPLITIYYW